MSDPARRSLDELLLYRLSRLLSVAGSMVIRLCEGRFGITRREWRLIATLASRGRLVEKGLLSRTHPAGDRRQVLLQLTERGQTVYDELHPLVTRINVDLLAALDANQAACLDEALRQLQARAEQLAGEAVLPKADRGRRGAG
jgi:hypothetical protein